MNVVETKKLGGALKLALRTAKSAVGLTKNVGILGEGGVYAANLKMQVFAKAEGLDVETPVDVSRLGKLLATLDSESVSVNKDDGLTIRGLNESVSVKETKWQGDRLRSALRRGERGCADWYRALACVAPAMSADETRAGLCRVYVDKDEDVVVATNGYWLAVESASLRSAGGMGGVKIPRAIVLEALAAAKAAGSRKVPPELNIRTARGEEGEPEFVMLDTPVGTFGAEPGAENFPDWRQVVPADSAQRVTVSRDALKKALTKLKKAWAIEGSAALHVSAQEGRLTLRAPLEGGGGAQKALDCEYERGPLTQPDDQRFGVSGEYLLAAVESLDSERVAIEWGNPESPIVLRREFGVVGKRIVMPMRVDWES